jgi:tripartite-type tricarboxylate transporter receptor subunit TctC
VALLTGEVQVGFAAIAAIIGHIRTGRLKALATGSKARHPLMPDVPTVAEAANLPGFEAANWYGIVGPAGMPGKLAQQLHRDLLAVVKSPEVAEGLLKQGFLINTLNPAEFRKFMIDDVAKWAETVRKQGAR